MTRHRGRRDQAARAPWVPKVATGKINCWRCGLPIKPDQPWDLGHLNDLALGAAPDSDRRPEHRRKADCPADGNRSQGAQLGLALRHGKPIPGRRPRRLSQWLEFFGGGRSLGPHLWPDFLPHPKPFENQSRPITTRRNEVTA